MGPRLALLGAPQSVVARRGRLTTANPWSGFTRWLVLVLARRSWHTAAGASMDGDRPWQPESGTSRCRQGHRRDRGFLREGVRPGAPPEAGGQDRLEHLHERRRGESRAAAVQERGRLGLAPGWIGIHHFGFQCDDLPAQQKQIEKAGGKFFFDLGEPEDEGFERKFKDPNGIVFDINWKGWSMTWSRVRPSAAPPATAAEGAKAGKADQQAQDRPGPAHPKITPNRRGPKPLGRGRRW